MEIMKSNEELSKTVQEVLRKHGFRFEEHNVDYDGPVLTHPALYGVLALATEIHWGPEIPWYVHNGHIVFTIANSEPSISLTKEFWYDEVMAAYAAMMLDAYSQLPYDLHKESK